MLGIGLSFLSIRPAGTGGDETIPDPVDTPPKLAVPENQLTPAQSTLDDLTPFDARNYWEFAEGKALIPASGLAKALSVSLSKTLPASAPVAIVWDQLDGGPNTKGLLKPQVSGGTTLNGAGRVPSLNFQHVQLFRDTQGTAQGHLKPVSGFDGRGVDNIGIYDLSSTDPTQVACDVVILFGDSNMSNSTSEYASLANLQYRFDPRIWYMPSLSRQGGNSFNSLDQIANVPYPACEPLQHSDGGFRVSPGMALAHQLADWAASRGRPLLLLTCAMPGSGLNGATKGEQWRKTGGTSPNAGEAYQALLGTVAAMRALGPTHEIVALAGSIGANDRTGADYKVVWEPHFRNMCADFRADLGKPDLPIAILGMNPDFEDPDTEDRTARMNATLARLDGASGSDVAVPGVTYVPAVAGHSLTHPVPDIHFTAAGMQANGRNLGQALLSMLD